MTGTVVCSVEVELGWGLQQLPTGEGLDRFSLARRRETETLDRLLTLCDELDLPISFDVVGHLLLEECDGSHEGPHQSGWFDGDPGTDIETDPLYYAPDLVEAIQKAEVNHEVCTHTFSHVRCGSVPESVLEWELSTVARQHAEAGLPAPRSLVPPVHDPPPLDVLAANGIRTVRLPATLQPPVATPEPPPSTLRRLPWHIRKSYPYQVLARSHPVDRPEREAGVLKTVSTWHTSLTAPHLPSGQQRDTPPESLIPVTARQWLHKRYLRNALRRVVTTGAHAHFWSHLFDFANDPQWELVRSFLRTVAETRDSDELTVRTMDQLGDGSLRSHMDRDTIADSVGSRSS